MPSTDPEALAARILAVPDSDRLGVVFGIAQLAHAAEERADNLRELVGATLGDEAFIAPPRTRIHVAFDPSFIRDNGSITLQVRRPASERSIRTDSWGPLEDPDANFIPIHDIDRFNELYPPAPEHSSPRLLRDEATGNEVFVADWVAEYPRHGGRLYAYQGSIGADGSLVPEFRIPLEDAQSIAVVPIESN